MKVKIPYLKNKIYCNIIYKIILEKEITASDLARELKKKQPVMYRQLKDLENEGFLISKRGDKLNKRLYSVNSEKLIHEFILYLRKKNESFKDLINYAKSFDPIIKDILKSREEVDKEIRKEIVDEAKSNLDLHPLYSYNNLQDKENKEIVLINYFNTQDFMNEIMNKESLTYKYLLSLIGPIVYNTRVYSEHFEISFERLFDIIIIGFGSDYIKKEFIIDGFEKRRKDPMTTKEEKETYEREISLFKDKTYLALLTVCEKNRFDPLNVYLAVYPA